MGCAFLCDLDGTLADSLTMLRDVYRRFLEGHGLSGSPGEFDRYNGVVLSEVIGALQASHHLIGSIDELRREYEALIDEHYLEAPPQPGAPALLETVTRLGWGCAVVTSGTANRARMWLERHGLVNSVQVVVGSEDVSNGKPNPEPYARAAQLLRAEPAAAWAVEDSMAGLTSAIAAGIGTVVHCGALLPLLPGNVVHTRSLWEVRDLWCDRNDPAYTSPARERRHCSKADPSGS